MWNLGSFVTALSPSFPRILILAVVFHWNADLSFVSLLPFKYLSTVSVVVIMLIVLIKWHSNVSLVLPFTITCSVCSVLRTETWRFSCVSRLSKSMHSVFFVTERTSLVSSFDRPYAFKEFSSFLYSMWCYTFSLSVFQSMLMPHIVSLLLLTGHCVARVRRLYYIMLTVKCGLVMQFFDPLSLAKDDWKIDLIILFDDQIFFYGRVLGIDNTERKSNFIKKNW